MSEIGVLVSAALAVLALIGVGLPFLPGKKNNDVNTSEEYARDELLTTYERVLATIRDLDEDYRTGKMLQDTYQLERSYWTERGIALLQQLEPDLDEDVTSSDLYEHQESEDVQIDDAIELAIRAYKQAQSNA